MSGKTSKQGDNIFISQLLTEVPQQFYEVERVYWLGGGQPVIDEQYTLR